MNLDGIIEDYPNATSPLNKATFTNLANAILSTVCPIGKVEVFYDNDDHSDYLGFAWERTSVGRTIVGIDETQTEFNTIGKTGGAKTHTLTEAQIPAHKHRNTHYVVGGNASGYSGWEADMKRGTGGSGGPYLAAADTSSVGSGTSHNNLQPYEVFAIWKRVA